MNPQVFPPYRRDPYAALRYLDFRLLLAGRFISSLGSQMLSFAVGWELWLRTHNALALGLVGLVQVTPVILLSLPAGHVADQHNRKRIVLPGHVAVLSGEVEEALPGWEVKVGPREAVDIPAFMKQVL